MHQWKIGVILFLSLGIVEPSHNSSQWNYQWHYRWNYRWQNSSFPLQTRNNRPQKMDVTYDELIGMNATCDGLDSCLDYRNNENLLQVNCHCGPSCVALGTCCVNSQYRTSPQADPNWRENQCRVPKGQGTAPLIMVSKCRPNWDGADWVKELCSTDDENTTDPFLKGYVTDIKTGFTYINYYCYLCNADNPSVKPVFWNMKVFMESDVELQGISLEGMQLRDSDGVLGNNYTFIIMEPPKKLQYVLLWCREFVMSACASNWTDAITKQKCEGYTALVYAGPNELFRNPHCAICNYKVVSHLTCSKSPREDEFKVDYPPYGFRFVGVFSTEDKVQRCPYGQAFHKPSNRCRGFRCGANLKLVDGKCVDDPDRRNRPRSEPNRRRLIAS